MLITTYEEAAELIRRVGILPLSSFVPEHPSLEGVTRKEAWHTGLVETDPWLWRDQFAGDGIAAYGRFFKKKPVLISADLFPMFKAAVGADTSVEDRYQDGLISRSVKLIYDAVDAQGGIDTKALRKAAMLADKEQKSEYDKALIELQESVDLVIAGISGGLLNDHGNKSGWNSTCYELAERWMAAHRLQEVDLHSSTARAELLARLQERTSEKASASFHKLFIS